MGKPLYMQLNDLQEKLNREYEHRRNVLEDLHAMKAERDEARATLAQREGELVAVREVLEKVRAFLSSEYGRDGSEADFYGELMPAEVRPVWNATCEALSSTAALAAKITEEIAGREREQCAEVCRRIALDEDRQAIAAGDTTENGRRHQCVRHGALLCASAILKEP